jgi:hypothetical protein
MAVRWPLCGPYMACMGWLLVLTTVVWGFTWPFTWPFRGSSEGALLHEEGGLHVTLGAQWVDTSSAASVDTGPEGDLELAVTQASAVVAKLKAMPTECE